MIRSFPLISVHTTRKKKTIGVALVDVRHSTNTTILHTAQHTATELCGLYRLVVSLFAGASLFMLKMHGKLRFQGACFATFRACSFISSVSIDCHFLVTFSLSHLGTLLRMSVALVCLCEMWQC